MNAVAEFVGLHPNYVSAIYKKETGVTVINALRSIRMERAQAPPAHAAVSDQGDRPHGRL